MKRFSTYLWSNLQRNRIWFSLLPHRRRLWARHFRGFPFWFFLNLLDRLEFHFHCWYPCPHRRNSSPLRLNICSIHLFLYIWNYVLGRWRSLSYLFMFNLFWLNLRTYLFSSTLFTLLMINMLTFFQKLLWFFFNSPPSV